MNIKHIVREEKTLNAVLREDLALSSRIIRKIKKSKSFTVNNIHISINAKLRVNDEVMVVLPKEENIFEPEDLPVDIRYESDHLMLVNKQPFMVVHPTKGHPFNTLANGLAHAMLEKGEQYKIRFANRLDRDTSGLVVVCKSGYGQKIVSDQMIGNTIIKEYDAIVEGIVEKDKETINEPIGRAYEDSVHRVVRPDGMPSVTHYEVKARWDNYTWLRVRLETGRTHQIRVHMKHIGHPLVGDPLYGDVSELINRQALHACHLVLKDVDGTDIDVFCEMPEDMKGLINQ